MVCTLYIYHKLRLEVHARVLSSTVKVCISNTWTPFLCYVSCHSKVSHSTLTNSVHRNPSFTNMVKKSHPFLWNPISVSQELALGPYSEPDESTHTTQFKNNFTTIVPPISESHKCWLTFRVSGLSFLSISCLPCMLSVVSILPCIWTPHLYFTPFKCSE
jgi:hypothetical protein